MAKFELKMPKLGESITEATITKWMKNVGDTIELDEAILEIATDKVDSEIPSPVEGVLKEQLFKEGDVVEVETVIAIIETGGAGAEEKPPAEEKKEEKPQAAAKEDTPGAEEKKETSKGESLKSRDSSGRFYSPLVRTIAKEENISLEELERIPGSGHQNRVTRQDVMDYLKKREAGEIKPAASATKTQAPAAAPASQKPKAPSIAIGNSDQVIEMSRMRKLIAEHMVMSEDTSVHITLFAEADMTNIVNWRNKQKGILQKREGEKLTFTPIFIEAIAKALRDYPMVNISTEGDKIVVRKNVNIGMAAATPDGNLIVPVIKNADHKSLLGLTKEVNDLANRARASQLKPDEIQGGTFTLTNFGTFGAIGGTPIINQPQVAILGVGIIQKKPVVIESPQGDSIGIRHMMMLSLSCDHRVVDGALGSMFLKRVADYLENFDTSQNI
ncbi:MAG: dihydrolipoamide acetyltransferase family protein [Bacteroidales bacterium]|jgi:2-oxoglutarate dehydrogenase E2 component (dihydrolipoamide succinyltransferase)|nr:dihydrolipoamide acetyltransferase family protein [Bacteroidales bacterium]NLM93162.1 2-oxo acid dehydrogenase subunit E2 [Bacteroidales bacterium]